MTTTVFFSDELKNQWLNAMQQAKADRPAYLNWIRNEINIAIELINKYDKIYMLGGLGAKLLESSPNFYNQFLETYDGPDKEQIEKEKIVNDDEIEVLLEYAMSIASANSNSNAGIIPKMNDIEEIRKQLSKIKQNLGFYEMSADYPDGGNQSDHWLKIQAMEEFLHVRGVGYQSHIIEIYNETFGPHDGFLKQYYGVSSGDILNAIKRLDLYVASKMGNPYGGRLTHQRLMEWMDSKGKDAVDEEMSKTGKHFIQQFLADNPDLYDKKNPDKFTLLPFDYIEGYSKFFWVIPKTEIEQRIFELISHSFGDNKLFIEGKFGGFPMGDSILQTKPLIKYGIKYYCFSITLPFRSIFNITAKLLNDASPVYYEQTFLNNSSASSRDNYLEVKVKKLFESFLPTVQFYHSLSYEIVEDGLKKVPELDILGVGEDDLYIIEVKAGELNKKHRRGAILGLKDRLTETINEGSYQCYRAEKYIQESNPTVFSYIESNQGKTLTIDKKKKYNIIKISVTFEHLSTISVNLRYLIESGVLKEDYKWTWIVSLYDLMVFADLIENETDFKEYLQHRLSLYSRSDVEFHDEIDILGYFMDNKFPLADENPNQKIMMIGTKEKIETYYTRRDVGMPDIIKPVKTR